MFLLTKNSRILVANSKGGSGKTTVSVNLAAWCALQGYMVELVDCDRQRSSTDWVHHRSKDLPSILVRQKALADSERQSPSSIEIVDAPAGCTGEQLLQIVDHVDLMLIPVLPSAIDVRAAFRFYMEMTKAGVTDNPHLKLGFIANRIKSRTLAYQKLSAFLNQVNIPFVAQLRDTQNYNLVMETGRSIFELPLSRARTDIGQWAPLLDWLKQPIEESRELSA